MSQTPNVRHYPKYNGKLNVYVIIVLITDEAKTKVTKTEMGKSAN